jgi:hypothetical protein
MDANTWMRVYSEGNPEEILSNPVLNQAATSSGFGMLFI